MVRKVQVERRTLCALKRKKNLEGQAGDEVKYNNNKKNTMVVKERKKKQI